MKYDVTKALDALQGIADTLIATQTNRRIQLGREKEARMVDAYQYMLGNEEQEIGELETALDSIKLNLESRGVELKDLGDQYKTISSEELLAAANEGATELINAKLEDSRNYRNSLQEKKSKAMEIKRNIDLVEESLTLIDPKSYGKDHIVEAGDVAKAGGKFIEEGGKYQEEVKQYMEFRQTPEQLALSGVDWFAHQKQLAEQEVIAGGVEHTGNLAAIESLEVPRQQIAETLKIKTQDPALVLSRHFASMGALKAQISEETVTSKQEALKTQLQQEYADLGGILYPALKDDKGNWTSPTEETHAGLAEDLGVSLDLLRQGDPTEFVNYLEHVQSYYDEMKQDQTETGRAVSNRVRQETLSLLGIDLEVPVKFGDEVMSEIELILSHYKGLERLDLEQSFHGIQILNSVTPNVSLEYAPPDSLENQEHEDFMKSRRRQ